MSSPNDEFDLLGISTSFEQPSLPQEDLKVGPSEDDPSIALPSSWSQEAGLGLQAQNPSTCSLDPSQSKQEFVLEPGQRKFIVRCEGRWRVRSAPSLSSKVIGTVANGTVVVGQDHLDLESEAVSPDFSFSAVFDAFSSSSPTMDEASKGITSLWIRVHRLEAQEIMGVSEIKRDVATGGELFCLRRNAMGFGLYEDGVEALDGPLIKLPEKLAVDLRMDAQRAASDRTEDVSLTWKLLGLAESAGKFFSSMGTTIDEGGNTEDMKPIARRRPEDVFEVKQREQLKKVATTLKTPVEKMLVKATCTTSGDLFSGLPREIAKPFARIRSQTIAASTAATNSMIVIVPQPGSVSSFQASSSSSSTQPKQASGSIEELRSFIHALEKIERTGGWTELTNELKQEITSFTAKHARDVESYASRWCKVQDERRDVPNGNRSSPSGYSNSMDAESLLFADFPVADSVKVVPEKGPSANASLPFLPPPPAPTCGVNTTRLI